MPFKEIADDVLRHGWSVFPVAPRAKHPLLKHGFKEASKDQAVIDGWAAKWPNANAGVAGGASDVAVLDIDYGVSSFEEFELWRKANKLPETYTVRTGRRPDFGVQMYFKGAIPDVGMFELDGCKGQVKSLGGYVLAAGSTHPSGALYEVIVNKPLAETPDVVRALKTKKTNDTNEDGSLKKIGEGEGRRPFLTSVAGKLRNEGLDYESLLAALIPINEARCEVPVSLEDLEHIAKSVCRYPVPEPDPVLVLGKVVDPQDDADDVPPSPRPKYPDEIWNGTAYGDFADLCTADNNIPKRFFSESFRTVVGALMGDKLRCDVQGGNPRVYTILIAPPGKGKGTACSLVSEFFEKPWEDQDGTHPPLLFRGKSPYRRKGIGAWIVNPASAPGLMNALEPEKPAKNKPVDPLEMWSGVPRLLTINEEIKTLFANFTIETTGAGLESCLCELYDRQSFSATSTAKRKQAAGEASFSILGGITPDGWAQVFASTNSVESGFLSRVNIVASEGGFKSTAGLDLVDFTELRRAFLPRILELVEREQYIRKAASATAQMNQWFCELDPEPDKAFLRTRINIHAWRTALHLAWLKRSDYITEEHVLAGIKSANYQIQMREFYAPAPGDTRQARCEANIRKVMNAVRRISVRDLKTKTNAYRSGIQAWEKSLDALVKNLEVRIEGKLVILLKEKR